MRSTPAIWLPLQVWHLALLAPAVRCIPDALVCSAPPASAFGTAFLFSLLLFFCLSTLLSSHALALACSVTLGVGMAIAPITSVVVA